MLRVCDSNDIVVCMRTRKTGYSGAENPLFYDDNAMFLPGGPARTLEALIHGLVSQGESRVA